VADAGRHEAKPKARLFRPIPTTTDEIAAALKTLQTAQPVLGSLMLLIEGAVIASDAGVVWTCSALGAGATLMFVALPAGTVYKHRRLCREFYERARG